MSVAGRDHCSQTKKGEVDAAREAQKYHTCRAHDDADDYLLDGPTAAPALLHLHTPSAAQSISLPWQPAAASSFDNHGTSCDATCFQSGCVGSGSASRA